MKTKLIIIRIILVCGFVFYLTGCKNKPTASNIIPVNPDTSKVKVHHIKENAFDGLRSMAFSVTHDQLGLLLPPDKTVVFGVIMDWGMDGAIATIVSYQTGDASLYLSSGGAIIGGGQHENVSNAAKQFVSLAQMFLYNANKTQMTTLPITNQVKFYLLTNNGIYVGQDVIKNFENHSSEWLQLFEEGNKVLTEIRLTTETK